jgi:hypothetical protein
MASHDPISDFCIVQRQDQGSVNAGVLLEVAAAAPLGYLRAETCVEGTSAAHAASKSTSSGTSHVRNIERGL